MCHQSRLCTVGKFLFLFLILSWYFFWWIFCFLLCSLQTIMLHPCFNNLFKDVIQLIIVSVVLCLLPNPASTTCPLLHFFPQAIQLSQLSLHISNFSRFHSDNCIFRLNLYKMVWFYILKQCESSINRILKPRCVVSILNIKLHPSQNSF